MMKQELRQEMRQLVQKSETPCMQEGLCHHPHSHQGGAVNYMPCHSSNLQSQSHTQCQKSKSKQVNVAHSTHENPMPLKFANAVSNSDLIKKTPRADKLAPLNSNILQAQTSHPGDRDEIKPGAPASNPRKQGAETSWFSFLETFLPYFETIEECLDHVAGEIGKILVAEIVELTHEEKRHGNGASSVEELSPAISNRELKLSPARSHRELKLSPARSHRELKPSPARSHRELKLSPARSHKELRTENPGGGNGSVEQTKNPLQSLTMGQAQSESPQSYSRRDLVMMDRDSAANPTVFYSCHLPSHHQNHLQCHNDEDTSREASELAFENGLVHNLDSSNARSSVSTTLGRHISHRPRSLLLKNPSRHSNHSEHDSLAHNSHRKASLTVHSGSNQSKSCRKCRAEARLKALGSHSQDHVARPLYPKLKTNSFHFLQAPGESNVQQQGSGQSISENTLSGKLSSCYEMEDESVSTEDCFSEPACASEAPHAGTCSKPSKKTKLKKALKTMHRSLSDMKEKKRLQPPLVTAAMASSQKEDTDFLVEKSLRDHSISQYQSIRQPSAKDDQPSISCSEFKTVNSYTSDQPTIFLDTVPSRQSSDVQKIPTNLLTDVQKIPTNLENPNKSIN
ncbi:unnamed protein product [Lymnaea stagnalis]|uniref:Uncharacterized protein n=1 Tax=Lymnaea stagnalis TaxID=6523 RepID=A0AAV2HXX5_LYMST